ncbi:MAG: peptide ligase PGM1-related protein [Actinomycetota bacterium]
MATVDAMMGHLVPAPGSEEERTRFHELQRRLAPMVSTIFPDRMAERTVVVIPSLSLDRDQLHKIDGIVHYEERMLCLLMLLRMPRTRIVYVTSRPIPSTIVDYYLHLLPGVPAHHARNRLSLLSCNDGSPDPLSEKILIRPRLLERVRAAIPDPATAHMTCFNSTGLERTLTVQLRIPMYANDPDLRWLGGKNGSRAVLEAAGVPTPTAVTDIRDADDVAAGIAELRRRDPLLRRAVVKLDEGFSGEGNAMFDLADAPETGVQAWAGRRLFERLEPIAEGMSAEQFVDKLDSMTGIVEAMIESEVTRSPSVQCRIDPLGRVEVISTHEQLLGGATGQVYEGCTFPADAAYRNDLRDVGRRVAKELVARGALGRFSVDFVSVPAGDRWEHYALEINLRKGGTTLPSLVLQFLTDGSYDTESGTYRSAFGSELCYHASDNVQSDSYRGLLPEDVFDIIVCDGLHFDQARQSGTVFHIVGAVSEYGKLGMVSIADSPEAASALHDRTIDALDRAVAPSV